jgi:hypothetical protein
MGWPKEWGWVLFFAVPLILSVVVGISAVREVPSPLLALVAGSDNRLSLSRLQAFAWTWVIFGGFAAATAVSTKVSADTWVHIPTDVLELAGIAIISGVFSSLIAYQTDEGAQTEVLYAEVSSPEITPRRLVVWGVNLGATARVRVSGLRFRPISMTAPVDEGVKQELLKIHTAKDVLIGTLARGSTIGTTLVVDTASGRMAYDIELAKEQGNPTAIALVRQRTFYELSDLFRDDKNPLGLDLMKFQMFGWTTLAIVVYSIFFISHLNADIVALPNVDQSIVVLTGISQAGYLAGKAVSGVKQP